MAQTRSLCCSGQQRCPGCATRALGQVRFKGELGLRIPFVSLGTPALEIHHLALGLAVPCLYSQAERKIKEPLTSVPALRAQGMEGAVSAALSCSLLF